MYFNIYSTDKEEFIENFDCIDLDRNIDLYEFKRIITKIEERFEKEYNINNKYHLCISNNDHSL